ncbi:MAG: hypothetical protein OXE48_08450, partial [Gammaproteobacteria bacterium]|nr:hypothetical protein [Gammaproteobacteria bacterium]
PVGRCGAGRDSHLADKKMGLFAVRSLLPRFRFEFAQSFSARNARAAKPIWKSKAGSSLCSWGRPVAANQHCSA